MSEEPPKGMTSRPWEFFLGVLGVGCGVQGAGCRVQGVGCRLQGVGRRVLGVGCSVQGVGLRVTDGSLEPAVRVPGYRRAIGR